jgi:hypothetical protein
LLDRSEGLGFALGRFIELASPDPRGTIGFRVRPRDRLVACLRRRHLASLFVSAHFVGARASFAFEPILFEFL